MMHALLVIAHHLDRVTTRIGQAASWLAVAMIVVILFDVISRRFFVLGSTKLQELEWHLHGALFLLTLGFAYMRDAHVRIELIRDRLAPRTRIWIELLGNVLFLVPYCLLLIYWDVIYAHAAFAVGETSATLGLSYRWIIKGTIGVGFGLLLLAAVAMICRCLVFLFGNDADRLKLTHMADTHHADLVEAGRVMEEQD